MSSLLSEVEPMDDLPFIANPTASSSPTTTNNTKPKLVAPSIDEVDEDPELLRTLRGEGRYFGISGTSITDDNSNSKFFLRESVPKCSNCSQRGHLKKNCPHVICTYCGVMDDHYSQHCPTTIRCSNCNETGHYRYKCPHKWRKTFCTLCNSKLHSRDRCPSIWRVYLLKDSSNNSGGGNDDRSVKLDFARIFCYNCGASGHFGDECTEKRSSKVPNDDGSAFSGENLPNALKKIYFEHLKKEMKERLCDSDEGYDNNNNNNTVKREEKLRHSRFSDNVSANKKNSNSSSNGVSMYDDDVNYNSNSNNNRNNNNWNSNRGNLKRKRDRNGGGNNTYLSYDDYGSYSDSSIHSRKRRKNGNLNNRGQQPPPKSRNHPLDFPRSYSNSNSNSNSNNYNSSGGYRNGYNGNSGSGSNYGFKRYKPNRSGVLRR